MRLKRILAPYEAAQLNLRRRGATFVLDKTRPDWPIVEVHFQDHSVDDDDLAFISRLSHIRRLNVRNGSFITPGGLAHLRHLRCLRWLHLTAPVTDAGLAHLGALPSLEHLYLTGAGKATGLGCRHFKSPLVLRHLVFGSRAVVTDEGVAAMARFRDLEFLGLVSDKLTDRSLQIIAGMTSLRGLVLNSARFSDAGIRHLKRLQQLEIADVHGRRITLAAEADFLRSLPRLRKP
jgi:hypothetical protein